jgi:hypothetical protein
VHDTEEAAETTTRKIYDVYGPTALANREAWVEVVIARCETASVSLIYDVINSYI